MIAACDHVVAAKKGPILGGVRPHLPHVDRLIVVVIACYTGYRSFQRPATPSFARPRSAGASGNQFRQDNNARFLIDRNGFLFQRRVYFVGTGCPPTRLSTPTFDRLSTGQRHKPQCVVAGNRRWWWFEDDFYWSTPSYGGDDMLALIRDRQRKEQARLDRAHTMLNLEQQDPQNRRRPALSRELKHAVFRRDGGRCVQCGSDFDIQYDHIIPFSLGGATTYENLQLLCSRCNQAKSANL